MNASTLVPIVVAILGAGGFMGGIVALLKLRPESGAIIVSAAQGAVVVQASVITDLRAENQRLRERVTALELERDEERAERQQERERMATLEQQLAALRAEVREDKAESS